YNESLTATEIYEKRYIKLLFNEGDIYIRSPWKIGKIYVLKNLAIPDDVNLLVLFTQHSYLNTIIIRFNLKSYCDIDVSIITQAQRQSIEKLYKLIQEAKHIIIMDNDLTNLNIKWIKTLRKNKPFSIIHNIYKLQKGIVHAFKTNFPELRIKEYHGKSDPIEKLKILVM
ncbi:8316_t:CDS:2, partial [Funneliformis geosporum]